MAHYDIFRHHLSIKFPAYGHALWEPNPGNLYPAVEVGDVQGDVGYIYEGKFRRLFNVLLPANHPSHRNFGVPEYHEQLTLNIENHIDIGILNPHNFYSAGVTLRLDTDRWADGPNTEGEVFFSCPMNQGAVLCLPIQAKREDTIARKKFGKWIIKHIDRWFAWARQLELGVDRMEDIILPLSLAVSVVRKKRRHPRVAWSILLNVIASIYPARRGSCIVPVICNIMMKFRMPLPVSQEAQMTTL